MSLHPLQQTLPSVSSFPTRGPRSSSLTSSSSLGNHFLHSSVFSYLSPPPASPTPKWELGTCSTFFNSCPTGTISLSLHSLFSLPSTAPVSHASCAAFPSSSSPPPSSFRSSCPFSSSISSIYHTSSPSSSIKSGTLFDADLDLPQEGRISKGTGAEAVISKPFIRGRTSPRSLSDEEEEEREDEWRGAVKERTGKSLDASGEVLKEEEGDPGKVFIGNLARNTTKTEIWRHLEQCGAVRDVILIRDLNDIHRNRGFAFGFFAGEKEEAKRKAARAATELNATILGGRPITVRVDDGRRERKIREEGKRRLERGELGRAGGGVIGWTEWHDEREKMREEFRRVLSLEPKDVPKVAAAFAKIQKPKRNDWVLLIRYYGSRGDPHLARATFENMLALNIPPSSSAYTALLHAYVVAGDMRSAARIFHDMEHSGVSTSAAAFSSLISGFARRGTPEAAEEAEMWYQKFKENGMPFNPIVSCSIVSAYSKVGWMEKAEEVCAEMRDEMQEIPLLALNSILSGYAKKGDEGHANQIMRSILKGGLAPSEHTFGALVLLYSRKGKMQRVKEVLREMEERGIARGRHIYGMVLDAWVKKGDMRMASHVFEEMWAEGVIPDAPIFNILISGFATTGEMERSMGLLQRMKGRGLRPTATTYGAIMAGFGRLGDVQCALSLLSEMRRDGVYPNVVVFNNLLRALTLQGKMGEAEGVVENMETCGIALSAHSYSILMDGYARKGDTASALDWFAKMRHANVVPDVAAIGSMVKGLCWAGRMQQASLMVEEMKADNVMPNAQIFNTLINGWAKRGDMWEAMEVLARMREVGVQPDERSFTTIIDVCCKAGDMQKAVEIFDEMRRTGIKPNVQTFTVLIHGWAWAAYPEKALHVYEGLKMAGVEADRAVFHCLLTCLLSRAAVATELVQWGIKMVAADMHKKGLRVDAATAAKWSIFAKRADREGSSASLLDVISVLFPEGWDPSSVEGAECKDEVSTAFSSEQGLQEKGEELDKDE